MDVRTPTADREGGVSNMESVHGTEIIDGVTDKVFSQGEQPEENQSSKRRSERKRSKKRTDLEEQNNGVLEVEENRQEPVFGNQGAHFSKENVNSDSKRPVLLIDGVPSASVFSQTGVQSEKSHSNGTLSDRVVQDSVTKHQNDSTVTKDRTLMGSRSLERKEVVSQNGDFANHGLDQADQGSVRSVHANSNTTEDSKTENKTETKDTAAENDLTSPNHKRTRKRKKENVTSNGHISNKDSDATTDNFLTPSHPTHPPVDRLEGVLGVKGLTNGHPGLNFTSGKPGLEIGHTQEDLQKKTRVDKTGEKETETRTKDFQAKFSDKSPMPNGNVPDNDSEKDSISIPEEPFIRDPIFLCRWVANRPNLSFAIALAVHVAFLAISGILVLTGYNLFPIEFETLPMELRDGPWLKRDYAFSYRNDYDDRIYRRLPYYKWPSWYRAERTSESIVLIYDAGSGNIFTKDKLEEIQRIENELISIPAYTSYCQIDYFFRCLPPVSVLRFFDGTYSSVDPVLNDPNFDNIEAVMHAAYTHNDTRGILLFHMSKNFQISSTGVFGTMTRSIIPAGWPMYGVSGFEAALNKLKEFYRKYFQPVLDTYRDRLDFGLYYYNTQLMIHDAKNQAFKDMLLAIGSMVFIFLFILFHTRSLWVTCLAELSIISSFVETNLFYRVVLDFRYFGYFHVLALFIILGIGADDLFVFWDAWKATGRREYPSLAHRLSEAYRKSAISMFVSSVTTMIAFAANALSPLLATKSFGVFAAVLVIIDYLSVITFFPTIVIFYHVHFEDKLFPFCCFSRKCCCKKTDDVAQLPSSRKYVTDDDQSKFMAFRKLQNVIRFTSAIRRVHPMASTTEWSIQLGPSKPDTLENSSSDTHNGPNDHKTVRNGVPPMLNNAKPVTENGVLNQSVEDTKTTGPSKLWSVLRKSILRKDDSTKLNDMQVQKKETLSRIENSLGSQDSKAVGEKTQEIPVNGHIVQETHSIAAHKLTSETNPAKTVSEKLNVKAGPGSEDNPETPQTNPKRKKRQVKREPHNPLLAPRMKSILVVFFGKYYFKFVTHKVIRWVIVTLLLALVIFFAVSVSKLKPDNAQIQLFKDDHQYSKAIERNVFGFVENDLTPTVTVFLLWGVRERDLSSCHFSDYKCFGTQQYNNDFNPNTEAAQTSLLELCETLFSLTNQQASDLRIKRDEGSGKMQIACFAQNMNNFLKSEALSSSEDVSIPWNWTQTLNFMAARGTHYDTSAFNSSFPYILDIPLTYWLWDAFRRSYNEDWRLFNSLIGEQQSPYTTYAKSTYSARIGNRIKHLTIAVNTTLQWWTLGYPEGIPIIERWEEFMHNQLAKMPPEMQGGFQTTYSVWHWIYVQRSLAENAILGIVLGVSLAFPVLVLATCNIVNGFLATFTICCVTVSVIGVLPLAGWKLGVLESLNMCLVVGLSVDYVVHLAEGYHMSHLTSRHARLKDALERMGISVFSGACTTLGASAFMLFAQIQFFFQFGLFMFCTIGFSLLFSMGLYVTVMGILGPQGDFGNIRVPSRACVARVKTWWEKRRQRRLLKKNSDPSSSEC